MSSNVTGASSSRHCSPPVGTSDGRVIVEQGNGDLAAITSVNWHLGIHTTLCYKVETGRRHGAMLTLMHYSSSTQVTTAECRGL